MTVRTGSTVTGGQFLFVLLPGPARAAVRFPDTFLTPPSKQKQQTGGMGNAGRGAREASEAMVGGRFAGM